MTPSPTEAAKRRQAQTMKTLHKTAEIYGAPDAVGVTLRLPPCRTDAQVGRERDQTIQQMIYSVPSKGLLKSMIKSCDVHKTTVNVEFCGES